MPMSSLDVQVWQAEKAYHKSLGSPAPKCSSARICRRYHMRGNPCGNLLYQSGCSENVTPASMIEQNELHDQLTKLKLEADIINERKKDAAAAIKREAFKEVEEYVKLNPKCSQGYVRLGDAIYERDSSGSGRSYSAAAFAAYDTARKLDPDNEAAARGYEKACDDREWAWNY